MATGITSSSGRLASMLTTAVISLLIEAIGTTASGWLENSTWSLFRSTTKALLEASSRRAGSRAARPSAAPTFGAKAMHAHDSNRPNIEERIFMEGGSLFRVEMRSGQRSLLVFTV
ncbi:hypothetical protein D9M71_292410 [compost metagenome]